MFVISEETPFLVNSVEDLLDNVFGLNRIKEYDTYKLRQCVDNLYRHNKVVTFNGVVVGVIRCWPAKIISSSKRKSWSCIVIGPIAIHTDFQSKGLGRGLLINVLTDIYMTLWSRIVIIGNPEYYEPFGFSRSVLQDVIFPNYYNQERVMGLETVKGSFSAVNGSIVNWNYVYV